MLTLCGELVPPPIYSIFIPDIVLDEILRCVILALCVGGTWWSGLILSIFSHSTEENDGLCKVCTKWNDHFLLLGKEWANVAHILTRSKFDNNITIYHVFIKTGTPFESFRLWMKQSHYRASDSNIIWELYLILDKNNTFFLWSINVCARFHCFKLRIICIFLPPSLLHRTGGRL